MNKYLVRDDGTVFPFDKVMAARKDMRPMSEPESERYDKCLKEGTKFTPNADGDDHHTVAPQLSEWALDLTNGEVLPVDEAKDPKSTIVLTVGQADIVLVYKADNEEPPLDLESMTNPHLIEYALENLGITIPVNSTKAEILAQINSASAE